MPTDPDDDSAPPTFSSPACYMHEFAAEGAAHPLPAEGVAQWRKTTRGRLIADRQAAPAELRAMHTALIVQQLESQFAPGQGAIIGAFWPIRGEPDFRPWMRELTERGVRVALPVIVGKDLPLLFREWRPEGTLKRGVWGIPEPADGETLMPTLLLAPLVGFDDGCYRLGYGGGYFDRTLAALTPRPLCIGVGSAAGHLATIYPQTFDQPMDWIVTGQQPARQRPR